MGCDILILPHALFLSHVVLYNFSCYLEIACHIGKKIDMRLFSWLSQLLIAQFISATVVHL